VEKKVFRSFGEGGGEEKRKLLVPGKVAAVLIWEKKCKDVPEHVGQGGAYPKGTVQDGPDLPKKQFQ